MYIAFNNGMSIIWQDASYTPKSGEVAFSTYPTSQQLTDAFTNYATQQNNAAIKKQISDLEGTITSRRLREAVLDTDGGWLAALNTQIANLRSQLT